MTTEQHPITPPPELRRLWAQQAQHMDPCDPVAWLEHVSTQAARWGADQELEACCEWVRSSVFIDLDGHDALRAARRPQAPPSLAKQGCDALDTYIYGNPNHKDKERTYNTIRAALERLQELEKGND